MNEGRPAFSVLVWDLPVRVLHGALAGSVTVALGLGFGLDDDHPLFAYHALAGLFAAGALLLRVAWGLVGPGHARFSRWPLSWAALRQHGVDLVNRTGPRFVGHNPFAAWVMAALLAAIGGTVITGLAGGEDLHEALAVALATGIGAHLAGLVAHRARHGENLAPAILHGRKAAPPDTRPANAKVAWGVLCLLLLGLWAGVLGQGFDAAAGAVRLPFGAGVVALTDGDDRPASHPSHHARRQHDDD